MASLVAAAAVAVKVGSAAIDYGWTAYDIKNDWEIINDPNAVWQLGSSL
ncbi:hypothetical protein [uncultured Methanolobus sp.]|nr:hypothetical protein [uncultured Methanolobus sp.]